MAIVLVDDLLDECEPQADTVTSALGDHVEEPLPLGFADTRALVCNFE